MSRLLESLPVARVRPVAFYAFYAGSFRDHSGNGNHVINTTGRWERSNGVWCYLDGYAAIAASASLTLTEMTIFAAGDFRSQIQEYIAATNSATTRFYMTAADLRFFDGTITSNILTTAIKGKKSLAVSATPGEVPRFYLDAVMRSGVAIVNPSSGLDIWFMPGYSGAEMKSPIKAILFYNQALTPGEIAELHAWSQQLSSPEVSPNRKYFLAPFKRDNEAISRWDLSQFTGAVVPDCVGTNNAIASGGVSLVNSDSGRVCRFDGNEGALTIADNSVLKPTDALTVIAWVRSRTTGNIELVNYRKAPTPAYYSLYALRDESVVVNVDDGVAPNGVDVQSILPYNAPANEWSLIGLVFDRSAQTLTGYLNGVAGTPGATGGDYPLDSSGAGIAGLYIGGATATLRNVSGDFGMVEIYDEAKSAGWMVARYFDFAERLVYEEDFQQAPVSLANRTAGMPVVGTEYRIESGSWKITEDAAGKRLENIAAGYYSRLQDLAYGSWRIGFNKAAGSDLYCVFIASANAPWNDAAQNGYQLQVDNLEKVAVQTLTGGVAVNVLVTADAYVDAGVDYEIQILRLTSGAFLVYIRGGAYLTWTELGAGPEATHTTSAYSIVEADAGDKMLLDRQYLGTVMP